MSGDSVEAVRGAIAAGEKRRARQKLKPMLEAAPTAELWLLAADACESVEQEIGCVRRALRLDPQNREAKRRYRALKEAGAVTDTQPDMLPSLEALVDDQPPVELLTALPMVQTVEPDIFALKQHKRKQASRRWTYLGCAGSILLSLSSTYFLLTVIGSPIPAQIRQLLSGGPSSASEGTPMFGVATDPTLRAEPTSAPPKPEEAVQGTPVFGGDGALAAPGGGAAEPGVPASAGGDRLRNDTQFVVRPDKTVTLEAGSPISDVLDPGYAHEFRFEVTAGAELAIAIQFFSPTATDVPSNVAILDPDGRNAEGVCERDSILTDGSGTAFICQVNQSGTWKMQVFGRAGASTGVYVVTFDRM